MLKSDSFPWLWELWVHNAQPFTFSLTLGKVWGVDVVIFLFVGVFRSFLLLCVPVMKWERIQSLALFHTLKQQCSSMRRVRAAWLTPNWVFIQWKMKTKNHNNLKTELRV